MIRGCADCGGPGAEKRGCECRVCEKCLNGDHAKTCPVSVRLRSMTPADRKAWKAANAPEEVLTTQALADINKIPGVTAWRTKRRQGARAKDEREGLLDIEGFAAPEGWAIYVEMKRDHPDGCLCRSCVNQSDFAARAAAAGCVVVTGARTAVQAADGVRMGLARARARDPKTEVQQTPTQQVG